MATAYEIRSYHDPGAATVHNVAGINVAYKRNDNCTVDTNDQVNIPSTGEAFSWRKYFKIFFTGTPPTAIQDLVFYFDTKPQNSDPAQGHDGVHFYAGATVGYTTPVVGDESGPAGFMADVDVAPYDVANPLTLYSGTLINGGTFGGSGAGAQPYLVTQASLDNTASPGLKDPRNFYYRYYEF